MRPLPRPRSATRHFPVPVLGPRDGLAEGDALGFVHALFRRPFGPVGSSRRAPPILGVPSPALWVHYRAGSRPFSSFQFSRSVVSDSATPWTAARQASLSITNSRSPPKLMSIESVMPSSHVILCGPLSSCPQSFPASGSFQMSHRLGVISLRTKERGLLFRWCHCFGIRQKLWLHSIVNVPNATELYIKHSPT